MSGLVTLLAALEGSLTSNAFDKASILSKASAAEAFLDQQPSLEPSERTKAVSVLTSWLRSHEDYSGQEQQSCLRAVLQIASKLLGQEQASDNIAIQKGLLTSVTALFGKATDTGLIRTALEVIATLSVVEDTDKIISRLESIPLILELLSKHGDNVELLDDAITTLALLVKRTRNRNAVSRASGVKVLVDILKRHIGTSTVVVAVCRFLKNFTVKEEHCLIVLKEEGIEALMAAFNKPVAQLALTGGLTAADVRATIASAIWACSNDCSEVQNTLLSTGWLSSLSAVLKGHQDHAGLLEAALGIVRGLCRHAKYREDIMTLNFIKVAAQSMKDFPDSAVLQKEACGIFGNLATDPAIREQLGESGVLQEVVTALGRCNGADDRKVAKLALGALMNLSSSEANRDILAQTEVVPIIMKSTQTWMNNENILEYAVGVISHLSVHPICGKNLVEAGGVEALLLFLREHNMDLQVICKSLVALRRLVKTSSSEGNMRDEMDLLHQIACAGDQAGNAGIRLLVTTMETHMYDETVVKEITLLFYSLSKLQSTIPPLMSFAVTPCMKALEIHQNDAPAADAIASLLGRLPLEDDDAWSKGVESASKSPSEVLKGLGVAAQAPRDLKASGYPNGA